MACAGHHERYNCWLFEDDTETWTKTHDTFNNHHQGAMARYNDSVVFVGGIENEEGSTEYYSTIRLQWSVRSNDTMFVNINGATAIAHQGSLYHFGKYSSSKKTSNTSRRLQGPDRAGQSLSHG